MCAGVLRSVAHATGIALDRAGDFLVVVGEPRAELTGSAYVREVLGEPSGAPPALDLEREARLHELAVLAAEGGWVRSAHDVSDGGLLVALAEMALATTPERGLGIELDVAAFNARVTPVLFSERSAIVFAVRPERAARLFQAARERALLAWPAGTVHPGAALRVVLPQGPTVEWTIDELREAAARPLARLWNEELE
jgi:phosphoribosylformylglycinamidine synthase